MARTFLATKVNQSLTSALAAAALGAAHHLDVLENMDFTTCCHDSRQKTDNASIIRLELSEILRTRYTDATMDLLSQIERDLLLRMFPEDPDHLTGGAYCGRSKLKVLLGDDIFDKVRGKTVVDFGCGHGEISVELAQNGAGCVFGLDIRESILKGAREKAVAAGLGDKVKFVMPAEIGREVADVVISLDAFEHFADPGSVLLEIFTLLKPGGTLLASFGPLWKHPWGGHTFAPFPWAHLLLSEPALCAWYTRTKGIPLKRFQDVSGGLNKMTVRKFEGLVRSSPFRSVKITPVPIRRLRRFHNRLTREFLTATLRCELHR